jgi:hypothetical protein
MKQLSQILLSALKKYQEDAATTWNQMSQEKNFKSTKLLRCQTLIDDIERYDKKEYLDRSDCENLLKTIQETKENLQTMRRANRSLKEGSFEQIMEWIKGRLEDWMEQSAWLDNEVLILSAQNRLRLEFDEFIVLVRGFKAILENCEAVQKEASDASWFSGKKMKTAHPSTSLYSAEFKGVFKTSDSLVLAATLERLRALKLEAISWIKDQTDQGIQTSMHYLNLELEKLLITASLTNAITHHFNPRPLGFQSLGLTKEYQQDIAAVEPVISEDEEVFLLEPNSIEGEGKEQKTEDLAHSVYNSDLKVASKTGSPDATKSDLQSPFSTSRKPGMGFTVGYNQQVYAARTHFPLGSPAAAAIAIAQTRFPVSPVVTGSAVGDLVDAAEKVRLK